MKYSEDEDPMGYYSNGIKNKSITSRGKLTTKDDAIRALNVLYKDKDAIISRFIKWNYIFDLVDVNEIDDDFLAENFINIISGTNGLDPEYFLDISHEKCKKIFEKNSAKDLADLFYEKRWIIGCLPEEIIMKSYTIRNKSMKFKIANRSLYIESFYRKDYSNDFIALVAKKGIDSRFRSILRFPYKNFKFAVDSFIKNMTFGQNPFLPVFSLSRSVRGVPYNELVKKIRLANSSDEYRRVLYPNYLISGLLMNTYGDGPRSKYIKPKKKRLEIMKEFVTGSFINFDLQNDEATCNIYNNLYIDGGRDILVNVIKSLEGNPNTRFNNIDKITAFFTLDDIKEARIKISDEETLSSMLDGSVGIKEIDKNLIDYANSCGMTNDKIANVIGGPYCTFLGSISKDVLMQLEDDIKQIKSPSSMLSRNIVNDGPLSLDADVIRTFYNNLTKASKVRYIRKLRKAKIEIPSDIMLLLELDGTIDAEKNESGRYISTSE